MATTYELWDTETRNLVAEFATEEEALEAVLLTLRANGRVLAETLFLGVDDEETGRGGVVAQGAALIALAEARAARAKAVDAQARHRSDQPDDSRVAGGRVWHTGYPGNGRDRPRRYVGADNAGQGGSGSWKKERASGRKYSGGDSSKQPAPGERERVWVSGYTRADGSKVEGHYRKNPAHKGRKS